MTEPETGTDELLDRLAAALGERPLGAAEIDTILDLARDVAHGSERRFAPLTTFLVGLALGRGDPSGARDADLAVLISRVAGLLDAPPA